MNQQQLGRYRILEQVAAGTQGTVFRAYDADTGRLVALKVLHPTVTGDTSYLDRFHREASLASSIDHPNVVQIFDVGEADGQHFIALEFLPENLSRLIGSGGLPIDRAARLAVGIADGLAEVHKLGIVHRDMKPQNVLITPDGTPKVTDFGIARTEDTSTMTATGALMGTPYYMSPEQARGEVADARSDVYATGCILYQMLTGEVPFDAPTPLAVIRQQIEQAPRPIRRVRGDVPKALAEVVERAMQKDPAQRYANGAEIAIALRQAAPGLRSEPVSTYRSSVPPPLPPMAGYDTLRAGRPGRFRRIAARAGMVAAIMVVGGIVTLAAIDFLRGGTNGDEGNPGGQEQGGNPTSVAGPTSTAAAEPTFPAGADRGIEGEPTATGLGFEGIEPLSTQEAANAVSRISTVATAIAQGDITPTPSPTPTPTETTHPAEPTAAVVTDLQSDISTQPSPAPARTPTAVPTPTPAPEPVDSPVWAAQDGFTFDGLRSVSFGPEGQVVVGGDQGYVYWSSDGGETWDSARTISGCSIEDLALLPGGVGFALEECGFGLMVTRDGGETWGESGLELLDFQSIGSLYFVSPEVGWVAGSSGLLAKTLDGGETWDRLDVPTRSFLQAVAFANEQVGWVAGLSGTLLSTLDGGVTWERIRTPQNCTIKDVKVRRPHVWAAGDCEQVMYSPDGGATWQDRSARDSGIDITAIDFLDGQTAWVAGQEHDPERPVILETANGGRTWREVPGLEKSIERIEDVIVAPTDGGAVGWAVGTGGLIVKLLPPGSEPVDSGPTDAVRASIPFRLEPRPAISGSLTWVVQDEFTFDTLYAVAVTEFGRAYAGGDGGAIYSSQSGGPFEVTDLPTGCTVTGLEFPTAEIGFAVDTCGGGLLRTLNGGVSWAKLPNEPVVDSGLANFQFLDGKRGWASGWDGNLGFTANGGESWEQIEAPTKSGIPAIYFADENHGWAGGLNNALLRTRDGGMSWEKADLPADICRIVAIDGHAPVVWAVDECSIVYISDDGGERWRAREIRYQFFPRRLTMWDRDSAWIGGEGGEAGAPVIVETRDGGDTWEPVFVFDELAGTIKDLTVVQTVDGPVGWAVGEGGLIVKGSPSGS